MVELDTMLSILQTISIIIGVFYYIMTLQNSNKTQQLALKAQELTMKAQLQSADTRQAQLFMYMYERWSSPELMKQWYELNYSWDWTDYEEFNSAMLGTQERYVTYGIIARFFEGVGVLVKKGLVDANLVDDLISYHLMYFWEKFGERYIMELRRRENIPQAYEHVEYLYNVIKPIAESQHPELKP